MRVVLPVVAVAVAALSLGGSSGYATSTELPASSRVVQFLSGDHRVTGVLNYRTRRAHLFANYDQTGNSDLGLNPGPVPSEDIEAAGVSYLRLRSCSDGPCWWRINHSEGPLAANLDQWATEDPFGLGALIKAYSTSEGKVEYIRGVRTRSYEGPIDTNSLVGSLPRQDRVWATEQYADLEQKSGGLASMSGAVWIDDDGLPRRLRIERSGYVTTWEYYDFGVEARIALPPEADVMSQEEVMRWPLEKAK